MQTVLEAHLQMLKDVNKRLDSENVNMKFSDKHFPTPIFNMLILFFTSGSSLDANGSMMTNQMQMRS